MEVIERCVEVHSSCGVGGLLSRSENRRRARDKPVDDTVDGRVMTALGPVTSERTIGDSSHRHRSRTPPSLRVATSERPSPARGLTSHEMIWIGTVVLVSVVLALLRGGKLSTLADLHLSGWWMLALAAAMQVGATFAPDDGTRLPVILVVSSFVPLLAVVWLNRDQQGLWIAGIGILMNFTVIGVNEGMPVLQQAVELTGGTFDPAALDAKHVVLDDSTRFAFLADIIPFPGSVISLGDVFLAIGLGVLIEDHMTRPLRLFRRGAAGVPGSAADR